MSHIRSIRWGVPVGEALVLSHRLCEVGWPVPFLAVFISPVFPPGTHPFAAGLTANRDQDTTIGSMLVSNRGLHIR